MEINPHASACIFVPKRKIRPSRIMPSASPKSIRLNTIITKGTTPKSRMLKPNEKYTATELRVRMMKDLMLPVMLCAKMYSLSASGVTNMLLRFLDQTFQRLGTVILYCMTKRVCQRSIPIITLFEATLLPEPERYEARKPKTIMLRIGMIAMSKIVSTERRVIKYSWRNTPFIRCRFILVLPFVQYGGRRLRGLAFGFLYRGFLLLLNLILELLGLCFFR